MRKYILLEDDTTFYNGALLYRIQSVVETDFLDEGDFGGYIESEENLSHDGECWVDSKAMVLGMSRITENAYVTGKSVIDDAYLSGDCIVSNSDLQVSTVAGTARVSDSVMRRSSAIDDSKVIDAYLVETDLSDRSSVKDARVTRSKLMDECFVIGNIQVKDCNIKDEAIVNFSCANEDISMTDVNIEDMLTTGDDDY